jgi:AT hook motif
VLDASKIDHPIDLNQLKATMPTATPTILDQISAEKTKLSERLARLDTDRETVATQLTDLETAERVLTRVSKTPPPARRPTSAAAIEAKAATATRGRGRPPKAVTRKLAGREPNAPSLGERVLALATGKTRQELYLECPNDRPNHIGIAVQRHLRAGRIQERDGKLYATSPAAQEIA